MNVSQLLDEATIVLKYKNDPISAFASEPNNWISSPICPRTIGIKESLSYDSYFQGAQCETLLPRTTSGLSVIHKVWS